MKSDTKKQIISKKIVVPVMALGVIAIATLSSANLADAHQSGQLEETLVERIASRFGLNETEVQDTFKEFKMEHREDHQRKMGEMLEERLEDAVESGDLTSDQMYAVLEKHEELEEEYDALYDLSPEEAREAKADMHEEMEAWALENDIDMEMFRRFEGKYYRKGMGGGMHMHQYDN